MKRRSETPLFTPVRYVTIEIDRKKHVRIWPYDLGAMNRFEDIQTDETEPDNENRQLTPNPEGGYFFS